MTFLACERHEGGLFSFCVTGRGPSRPPARPPALGQHCRGGQPAVLRHATPAPRSSTPPRRRPHPTPPPTPTTHISAPSPPPPTPPLPHPHPHSLTTPTPHPCFPAPPPTHTPQFPHLQAGPLPMAAAGGVVAVATGSGHTLAFYSLPVLDPSPPSPRAPGPTLPPPPSPTLEQPWAPVSPHRGVVRHIAADGRLAASVCSAAWLCVWEPGRRQLLMSADASLHHVGHHVGQGGSPLARAATATTGGWQSRDCDVVCSPPPPHNKHAAAVCCVLQACLGEGAQTARSCCAC